MEKNNVDLMDDKPQVINADLRKFNKSELMVKNAVASLTAIVAIKDQTEVDSTMITLKEASTVEKKIEEKRKELVKPFNDAVKKINEFSKKLVEKLPAEITRVKGVVIAFQKEEERKRQEAMRTARIEQLIQLGFTQVGELYKYNDQIVCADILINNNNEEAWNSLVKYWAEEIEFDKKKQLDQESKNLDDVRMFGTEEEVKNIEEKISTLQTSAPSFSEVSSPIPAATKVKGATKRWTFEIENTELVPREYLVVDEKKIREAVNAGTRTIPGVRIFQQDGLTLR